MRRVRPRAAPAPRPCRARGIGEERAQIVLPQREIAANKVFGVGHSPDIQNAARRRTQPGAEKESLLGRTRPKAYGWRLALCLRPDIAQMSIQDNDQPGAKKPVVVKKYANRRLYNTATSSYVTLEDLAKLIKDGGDFVAHDAKTGEDITRSVLTQIIMEEEQKGRNLLPISFLRQLISFYGDSMQFLVPGYLEQAMITFARNQEQMRKSLQATFGMFPFGQFEEMGKQNIALFERALRMLSPYAREERPAAEPAPRGGEDPRLKRLEDQIAALQRQLDSLGRERNGNEG
jgi:polyhydroxyalkanoate synthesis repressor PhaR